MKILILLFIIFTTGISAWISADYCFRQTIKEYGKKPKVYHSKKLDGLVFDYT